ncbi:hypothetical protein E3E22_10535 [Thermococcus sp. MV5]|uniref:hypothetical protein n=1 Tax=Thermococcus sp. MV5 TaxID=1638272 RepID=UPI001438F2D4|nr:hypothetical protein [Thermococcus sp. MV5]NJE27037.1 hypothetical protein [Thermococcus sp. MV5]
MVDKVKYVCLRCGNVYESRAKVPQCPLCRSKRKMKLEEFLALPEESRNKILGKTKKEKKEDNMVKSGEIHGETNGEMVKISEVGEKEGADVGKNGENNVVLEEVKSDNAVKKSESPKITKGEMVKKGETEKVKKSERVKGEKGKSSFAIPKPKVSIKGIAIISGLAFIYLLYKLGYFESVLDHLKRLGAFRNLKEDNDNVKAEIKSPVLERVRKNLSG